MEEEKVEGQESDGLAALIAEGNEDTSSGEGEGSTETKSETETKPAEGDGGLAERLAAAEAALAEREAELTWHRGQSKRAEQPKAVEKAADEIDMEALTAKLTSRDPKVAAQAVVDVAKQLVAAESEKTKKAVASTFTSTQREQAAKDEDRRRTFADFGELMNDKEFVGILQASWDTSTKSSGGVYMPNMLYSAAAVAEKIYNKQKASKAKGKNGVAPVRLGGGVSNPVESDTSDYSKAKTISELPDRILSPNDKAAAKAAMKRMGVSEADYVKTFLEELKEDRDFGRY